MILRFRNQIFDRTRFSRNLLEIPRFHSPYHTDNGRFEEGQARHFIDKLFSISRQAHGIIDAPSRKQSSTATSLSPLSSRSQWRPVAPPRGGWGTRERRRRKEREGATIWMGRRDRIGVQSLGWIPVCEEAMTGSASTTQHWNRTNGRNLTPISKFRKRVGARNRPSRNTNIWGNKKERNIYLFILILEFIWEFKKKKKKWKYL